MIWHNHIMAQGDLGKFFRYLLHPCFRNFPRGMRAATWGRPYKWEKVHPIFRTNRHKIRAVFTVIIILQPDLFSYWIFHLHFYQRLTGYPFFPHLWD